MTHPELILNSLSSSGTIRISVLIVTRNRAQILNKCLSALSSQTLSPSLFEVLIGDDDSIDETEEVVRSYMNTLQIYYSLVTKSNVCAVRSRLLSQARGEYVLFINDDTIADCDLLEKHCKAHQEGEHKKMHVMGKVGLANQQDHSIMWPCNVSVKRNEISDTALFHYESTVSSAESSMLKTLLYEKDMKLQTIYESDGWKVLSFYYRIKGKLFPYGSPMWFLASGLIRKVRNFLTKSVTYEQWIKKHEPSKNELYAQKQAEFSFRPLISIVVPVYNPRERDFKCMVESVLAQTYGNWELCLALGGDEAGALRPLIEKYMAKDSRIKAVFLDCNKGISGNTNEAVALASGDYVGFLDHEDLLACYALYEVVRVINECGNPAFIYSDEDKVGENDTKRSEPAFKPDFSLHLLRSMSYIGHLLVCRKSLGDETGWLRKDFDGAQDYDLILRLSEKAEKVVHIPKILYHWRRAKGSISVDLENKPYVCEAGRKALEDHIRRLNRQGRVEHSQAKGCYHLYYSLLSRPLVSIIIPNRDHSSDLERCVSSVTERSTYRNFEIVIVENGSRKEETFRLYDRLKETGFVTVYTWDQDFNYAAINNYAAQYAGGDFLLFLNNDTEVLSPDWIERMMDHAQWDEVGAAGAKLLFPDGTIQHAGITVEGSTDTSHRYYRFSNNPSRHFKELYVVQNVLAVTGACLLTRKALFIGEGGFDKTLKYYYNDADYCLRLFEKGLLNVWTPYALLYHHEMTTMKEQSSLNAEMQKDREYFRAKWSHLLKRGDPYSTSHLKILQNKDVISI